MAETQTIEAPVHTAERINEVVAVVDEKLVLTIHREKFPGSEVADHLLEVRNALSAIALK